MLQRGLIVFSICLLGPQSFAEGGKCATSVSSSSGSNLTVAEAVQSIREIRAPFEVNALDWLVSMGSISRAASRAKSMRQTASLKLLSLAEKLGDYPHLQEQVIKKAHLISEYEPRAASGFRMIRRRYKGVRLRSRSDARKNENHPALDFISYLLSWTRGQIAELNTNLHYVDPNTRFEVKMDKLISTEQLPLLEQMCGSAESLKRTLKRDMDVIKGDTWIEIKNLHYDLKITDPYFQRLTNKLRDVIRVSEVIRLSTGRDIDLAVAFPIRAPSAVVEIALLNMGVRVIGPEEFQNNPIYGNFSSP
ncbi:MAG: hypothetical protein KDD61_00345 [Bdellovibrionales bacterium]|nr:hypothetical protein [Bdellovibrionales bacterium]